MDTAFKFPLLACVRLRESLPYWGYPAGTRGVIVERAYRPNMGGPPGYVVELVDAAGNTLEVVILDEDFLEADPQPKGGNHGCGTV